MNNEERENVIPKNEDSEQQNQPNVDNTGENNNKKDADQDKKEEELKKDTIDNKFNEDFYGALEALLLFAKDSDKENQISIFKKLISVFKTNSDKLDSDKLDSHELISRKVFRRLLLRNAQLNLLERLYLKNLNEAGLPKTTITNPEKVIEPIADNPGTDNNGKKTCPHVDSNICPVNDSGSYESNYKHSITDLFVEKALTYLEEQAAKYQKIGHMYYRIGIILIVIAILTALIMFLKEVGLTINTNTDVEKLPFYFANQNNPTWQHLAQSFIISFTYYGFLVIGAVGCWRFGTANFDQAERLFEKRHALRQGRLFIHLSKSNLTIQDMEKAFANWNVSSENAFSRMKTDAKAPLGALLSDAIHLAMEIIKSRTQQEKEQAAGRNSTGT